jgi:HEAT repeat protein
MFVREDPVVVLNTSSDGDDRAKALRALKEPRVHGGSAADQEQVLRLLAKSATTDPQPVCRIAAVETLGRFEDPQAVTALTAAYESAGQLTGEAAGAVRCLALKALGETKQPAAAAFLTEVAQRPAPAEASDRERQQFRDGRLAAVRALGKYQGSREVADAMAKVLQSERDVAVRDRAKETYAAVTGREPPAEPLPPPDVNDPPKAGSDFQLTGHAPGQ